MKAKQWNRCDECGQFISYQAFDDHLAQRELILPDSEFTVETYETLCPKHNHIEAIREGNEDET